MKNASITLLIGLIIVIAMPLHGLETRSRQELKDLVSVVNDKVSSSMVRGEDPVQGTGYRS